MKLFFSMYILMNFANLRLVSREVYPRIIVASHASKTRFPNIYFYHMIDFVDIHGLNDII